MRRSSQLRGLKHRRMFQALALLIGVTIQCQGQTIATLEINLDSPPAGLTIPIELALESITHLPESNLKLVAIRDKKRIPVDFQVAGTPERKITWMIRDDEQKQMFLLIKDDNRQSSPPIMKTVKEDGALTLMAGNRNLLRYHYGTVYPPKGIDTVFRRSAFIHPLWSPDGQVLTRIQPPDHYHHYGIWNPWTHTVFEGDTIDFWNLNRKQGTVRFSNFTSINAGSIFGAYTAVHEHVATGGKKEKVAMNERQTVKVYAPQGDNKSYIADIIIEMNCPESPLGLLEYRYGGMGWRAAEAWTNENTSVITSEGKTRKDADGSKARWCIAQGTVDGKTAGIVMMSNPNNFNHPEPLRIWPENANRGRGDMFANFSPTRDMDWPLETDTTYVLKYRFIVFDGAYSPEKAEAAWHYFSQPPLVQVRKE